MKYNIELFKNLTQKKFGERFTVISEECNSCTDKVEILCNDCKNYFFIDANHFLGKSEFTCKFCKKIKRKNQYTDNKHSIFVRKVYELVGDEYSVIGNYTTTREPILIRHNICNKEYYITPNHFISGRRCSCLSNRGRQRLSEDVFRQKVKELVGDEYSVLGEFVNRDTEILMRHNCDFCNNREFMMKPSNFLGSKNRGGHRCEVCTGHKPTEESIKKRFNSLFESRNFSAEDVNIEEKCITIKHDCGFKFSRNFSYIFSKYHNTPDSLLCPKCHPKSKANIYITEYLNSLDINYISEGKIMDERVETLKFDFIIYLDEESYIIIELDGIQHKEMIPYFDDKDSFDRRIERDEIKNNFAVSEGISLYRVDVPRHVGKKELEQIKNEITKILIENRLL